MNKETVDFSNRIGSLRTEIKEAIRTLLTQHGLNYVSFGDDPDSVVNAIWVNTDSPECSCRVEIKTLEIKGAEMFLEIYEYKWDERWKVNGNDYLLNDLDTLNKIYITLQEMLDGHGKSH